jgi:hypothetical protein
MDIVERLREAETEKDFFEDWKVYKEAADEIERLEKENELLQKELKKHLTYQEHRYGRIGTHDPICYEYGPRHYECALREIDRLREALQKIKKRNPFHNVSPPVDKQYYAQVIVEIVTIANAALKESE